MDNLFWPLFRFHVPPSLTPCTLTYSEAYLPRLMTLFYASCRAEASTRNADTDLVSFLASRQHLTPAHVMSFFEIDSARFARCWDRVRRSVALDPSSVHVYLRDSPMTMVEELMSHFGLSRSTVILTSALLLLLCC